ncbi:dialkylrecorsinol condensing enzyme [Halioxenophilus sp. WMMB6]|uniref:dialkylrecorsinol condensing enzyme n=1 Tax=Halioxenophilus sp. WMMB6 TaxID=3073815 RepID=UPI00295E51B1|nr:dialkylrecorsinol condensing enzyme [Halioxenophilus sp. WMMB6]
MSEQTPKKILVLHYTQSGQLSDVLQSITAPLSANPQFELTFANIKPVHSYPFPWPFLTFFDTFPETVYDEPHAIEPIEPALVEQSFDLIILAYQVWFLSPSQPVTAFLQSPAAAQLLHNKPVITVIACRNMWLMAQEKMKAHLQKLGARLIDNIVLTDPAHSALTFFSTPMWVLTGNKGPYFNGLIPKAGVSDEDIQAAARFGQAIAEQLPSRADDDTRPMLGGCGAVSVNPRLIPSERVALRSFRLWGSLLRFLGKPGQPLRRAVLVFYIIFLITLILTVVPITALIIRALTPLIQTKINQQRAYFAAPSGEANH